MSSPIRHPPALKYSLLWLAATLALSPPALVASLVGIEIGYSLQIALDVDPFPLSIQLIVGLASFGAILGAAQWLVLRRLIAAAWQWILVSTITFPLAFQLADLVSPRSYTLETPFAVTLLSATQALFFTRYTSRAYLWIAFHAASGFLALLFPNLGAQYSISLFEALLGALLTGAIFALPGAAAVALMFSHQQNVAPPNNSMEPTRPAAA
jgi:hypothetical protein